jgi:hypothetical protein
VVTGRKPFPESKWEAPAPSPIPTTVSQQAGPGPGLTTLEQLYLTLGGTTETGFFPPGSLGGWYPASSTHSSTVKMQLTQEAPDAPQSPAWTPGATTTSGLSGGSWRHQQALKFKYVSSALPRALLHKALNLRLDPQIPRILSCSPLFSQNLALCLVYRYLVHHLVLWSKCIGFKGRPLYLGPLNIY